MSDDKADLRALVQELSAAARGRLEEHPSPAQLVAYRDGELAADAAEGIRDHLTLCHDCQDLMRDLAAFPDLEPAAGEPRLTEADTAGEWQSLRRLLATAQPPASLRLSPTDVGLPRASPVPPWLPWALAASLLVACLGLGGWTLSLRRQVSALSSPRLNPHVADLLDDSNRLRRPGEADRVTLPPEADGLVLLLNLADPGSFPEYGFEIRSADAPQGKPLWRQRGLVRSPEGSFSLALPPDFLPTGRYRLTLFGHDGEREVAVAVFTVELVHEPPA